MRIVGGEWRSRRIEAPAEGLRPTADRVREAVFNMLMNIVDFEQCTVCDLFAGSGAMGIEALSRGAQRATFVEERPETAAILSKNLRMLGAEDRATVIVEDALEYVRHPSESFELIFADPPYAYEELHAMTDAVLNSSLMRNAFVVEHDAAVTLNSGHTPWRHRLFGKTAITIFLREYQ